MDRIWRLDLRCAADWIGAMGVDLDGLVGVFPGSVGDEQLDDMWIFRHHPEAQRRWLNAARVAVERGSGRSWWWSVALTRKSLGMWPYINGMLLLRGVDAMHLPYPSWLDAAYMVLWERCDEQGRIKLDMELNAFPAGVAVRQSASSRKAMLEAFAAD